MVTICESALRRAFALGCTVAMCAGLGVGVASAAPSAGDNHCSVVMQNPHWSQGAGGHIAKASWKCALVPTRIDLTQFSGLVLYLCGVRPPLNGDWIFNNCAPKGDNVDSFLLTAANRPVTRYVPPSGRPGAHGNGWYIAVAHWQSHGPGGTGNLITSYSNPVPLHG